MPALYRRGDPDRMTMTEVTRSTSPRVSGSWGLDRALIRAAAVGVAAAVVTAVTTLLLPREYSVHSSFVPQLEGAASALSGVASQLGVSVGDGDPSQSPIFYADLLRSSSILEAAVSEPLTLSEGKTISLPQFFEVSGDSEAVRRRRAAEQLAQSLEVSTNARTGVVHLQVTTTDPEVSQAISARLLALVDEFNARRRRLQSRAERDFSSGRLAEARSELRRAEERLQGFLQRNRYIESDPLLVFERERLTREVAERREVASVLQQAFERSRLEAVRNTPLITVVEEPRLPAEPNRRRLLLKTAFALILGGLAALFVSRFAQALRSSRHDAAVAA